MILTRDLTKAYADVTALANCNLQIEAGEVYGLLGPNGAGKSTLIRLLMGFQRPTSGAALLGGVDCWTQPIAARQQVSYLPSSPKIFRTMSGERVLRFFSDVRSDGDYPRAIQIARRLDLNLKSWVAFMSTGMRQKLAIAVAFSTRTPILILDEPTENLDPNVRKTVSDLVREARSAGQCVLFSSHVLSEVEEIADRVGILKDGRLIHEQRLDSVRRSYLVSARFDGTSPAVPESLKSQITITGIEDDQIRMHIPGELAPALRWLGSLDLKDVNLASVGLGAVYERHHGAGAGAGE